MCPIVHYNYMFLYKLCDFVDKLIRTISFHRASTKSDSDIVSSLIGSIHRAPGKKVPLCLICCLNLLWVLTPCTTKLKRAEAEVEKNTVPSIFSHEGKQTAVDIEILVQAAFQIHICHNNLLPSNMNSSICCQSTC